MCPWFAGTYNASSYSTDWAAVIVKTTQCYDAYNNIHYIIYIVYGRFGFVRSL